MENLMKELFRDYEEININIKCIDYLVNFRSLEFWYYVDNGIGWYDYYGATGVHEDWEWELGDVDVSDVSIIEYDADENAIVKSIESFDPAFAINISEACHKYAKDNAIEP